MARAFDALWSDAAGTLPGEAGLRRRMMGYLDYLAGEADASPIQAPVTLILAEREAAEARQLETLWRSASRAGLRVLQGAGDHYGMLRPGPALEENARLIGQTLEMTSLKKPSPST